MTSVSFPQQNSTNFPVAVKNILSEISKKTYKEKDFLQFHQFIVQQYLVNNVNSRGLLLFHEMGMGKSITATSLAEYYREHYPDRKIVILLPKSLQANFQKNIEMYIEKNSVDEKNSKELISPKNSSVDEKNSKELISPKNSVTEHSKTTDFKSTGSNDFNTDAYKFISLNASNMFKQINRVGKSQEELDVEKQLKEFTDIAETDDFLENSLLIIDEFHNFSNAVTNGSYNAIRLYDTIMKTKDIKLLFLSGTPIINSPFELVPTFNMLKGLISTDVSNEENTRNSSKPQTTLFPELQVDFDLHFVDKKTNKIKNPEKFKNRIFGMCSYYGNLYFGKTLKEGFPEEYPIKVEKVPMSAEQYSRYNMARDFEREESSQKGFKPKADRFSSKSSASKSYRVQSRQVSNFLIPEYALGVARGKKSRDKFINKISDADLQNLELFSPKFKKILKNIKNHKNQLGLVYSEFVSGEGIAIFAKVLNINNYTCWNKTMKLKEASSAFDLDIKSKKKGGSDDNSKKKYAMITGDVSFDERAKIVKAFNDTSNKTGDKIALLLISKTGAEGLDLKNVRHVHLIEPYWNYARLSQIIARAVRYQSHSELGVKFRNVQPYIYLSDYPADFDLKKKKEHTTDIDLYTESVKNRTLINEFYIALASASIDCSMHSPSFSASVKEKISCKLCSPNNQLLYHPILSKQILLPDPCQELKTQTIKAQSISIPGSDEKYFYSKVKDQIHIFRYDDKVKGYIIMDSNEDIYSDIIKKLLKV